MEAFFARTRLQGQVSFRKERRWTSEVTSSEPYPIRKASRRTNDWKGSFGLLQESGNQEKGAGWSFFLITLWPKPPWSDSLDIEKSANRLRLHAQLSARQVGDHLFLQCHSNQRPVCHFFLGYCQGLFGRLTKCCILYKGSTPFTTRLGRLPSAACRLPFFFYAWVGKRKANKPLPIECVPKLLWMLRRRSW